MPCSAVLRYVTLRYATLHCAVRRDPLGTRFRQHLLRQGVCARRVVRRVSCGCVYPALCAPMWASLVQVVGASRLCCSVCTAYAGVQWPLPELHFSSRSV
jgi:hypothetical protein